MFFRKKKNDDFPLSFLAEWAGFSKHIFIEYSDIPKNERITAVRLGLTVPIPAAFGFFAGGYLIWSTVPPDQPYRVWMSLVGAVFWSSLVLAIDLAVLPQLTKSGKNLLPSFKRNQIFSNFSFSFSSQFLPLSRIVMALLLGYIVGEVALLGLFNQAVMTELKSNTERKINDSLSVVKEGARGRDGMKIPVHEKLPSLKIWLSKLGYFDDEESLPKVEVQPSDVDLDRPLLSSVSGIRVGIKEYREAISLIDSQTRPEVLLNTLLKDEDLKTSLEREIRQKFFKKGFIANGADNFQQEDLIEIERLEKEIQRSLKDLSIWKIRKDNALLLMRSLNHQAEVAHGNRVDAKFEGIAESEKRKAWNSRLETVEESVEFESEDEVVVLPVKRITNIEYLRMEGLTPGPGFIVKEFTRQKDAQMAEANSAERQISTIENEILPQLNQQLVKYEVQLEALENLIANEVEAEALVIGQGRQISVTNQLRAIKAEYVNQFAKLGGDVRSLNLDDRFSQEYSIDTESDPSGILQRITIEKTRFDEGRWHYDILERKQGLESYLRDKKGVKLLKRMLLALVVMIDILPLLLKWTRKRMVYDDVLNLLSIEALKRIKSKLQAK